MIKRNLSLLFLLLGLLSVQSQDNGFEETFLELFDKVLQLNIVAKVLPPGHQPVWNMKSTKFTIPGRSVAVKLIGNNIRVDVVFTPYQEENGSLFLVAQGQVWLSEDVDKEIRYLTTIKSIPVSLGEKVLFFPLGFPQELPEQKCFNIQLEIEIFNYRDILALPSE